MNATSTNISTPYAVASVGAELSGKGGGRTGTAGRPSFFAAMHASRTRGPRCLERLRNRYIFVPLLRKMHGKGYTNQKSI